MNSYNILFVCTGNICRSPMAESYFRFLCENKNIPHHSIISAGTCAVHGCHASRYAIDVLHEEGVSLSGFMSRPLSRYIIETSSKIVAMTSVHISQVVDYYPQARGRIFLLMSYIGLEQDVEDPYGGSLTDYQKCFKKMKPALDALFESCSKKPA